MPNSDESLVVGMIVGVWGAALFKLLRPAKRSQPKQVRRGYEKRDGNLVQMKVVRI